MPGVAFAQLAERFVLDLELAGATVLVIRAGESRPCLINVIMDGEILRLEVYLWAITPGGRGRGRPNERRIQMTGIDRFTLKPNVRTIIGGFSEEAGVYGFWDVRRHLGFKAGSPSLQISRNTLEDASSIGMASEVRTVREGQEAAIGVHPDYLMWYVREYQNLYDCDSEIDEAANLVEAKPEEERSYIDSGATAETQSRRHKVVQIVQNFRQARFRPLVLRAYSFRCCLTGVALRLVDAAHIVPVSDPTSTDEPRNGVALNSLMHRAYDCGLLGLLPGGRTAINNRMLSSLSHQKLDSGIEELKASIPGKMQTPTSNEFVPPDDYLIRGLKARGWSDAEIQQA